MPIHPHTRTAPFHYSITYALSVHVSMYMSTDSADYDYREEFTRHGMDDVVTLTHRNVCKDGFTVEDTADAGTSAPPSHPTPSHLIPPPSLPARADLRRR